MSSKKKNQLKFWGKDFKSMNLPRNVVSVIYHAEFFHNELYKLKSFNEVVREIEKQVDTVYTTNPLSPSKCMMFLYKLHIMRMTKKQLDAMLGHKNAFLKAMAVIYVRFTIPPPQQMEYYENSIKDESVFSFRKGQNKMTISELIKLLIIQKKCLGILAPRIVPKKISDELENFVVKNARTSASLMRRKREDESKDRMRRKRKFDGGERRNEYERQHDKRRKIDHLRGGRRNGDRAGTGRDRDGPRKREKSPVESRFSKLPSVPANQVLSNTLYSQNADQRKSSSSIGSTLSSSGRGGLNPRLLNLLRRK